MTKKSKEQAGEGVVTDKENNVLFELWADYNQNVGFFGLGDKYD